MGCRGCPGHAGETTRLQGYFIVIAVKNIATKIGSSHTESCHLHIHIARAFRIINTEKNKREKRRIALQRQKPDMLWISAFILHWEYFFIKVIK